jgi:hypothetical protein
MTANLFKTLVLAASVLSMTAVQAKDTRIVNFPATCVSAEEMIKMLIVFDEKVSLNMISTREGADGKTVRHPTLLFINYETKSWTLIEKIPTDEFCVIASGENVTPYIKKELK